MLMVVHFWRCGIYRRGGCAGSPLARRLTTRATTSRSRQRIILILIILTAQKGEFLLMFTQLDYPYMATVTDKSELVIVEDEGISGEWSPRTKRSVSAWPGETRRRSSS